MVSYTLLTGLVATILLATQIQAQGTQGGHTGGVKGTQPVTIQVCEHNGKCDWSLKLDSGKDSFAKKNTNCDAWTTPKGVNGVYKVSNFNKEDPLSEIVLDVKKCDYYKMVDQPKVTHTGGKTCHTFNAKVC